MFKKKVRTIKNFLKEYKRIKPLTMEEFNEKRNTKIMQKAEKILELFDCPNWYWFVCACELPFYIKIDERHNLITYNLPITDREINNLFPAMFIRELVHMLNKEKENKGE